MLIADNITLMSKMEALEAEDARLKSERSKLKKQFARERYQLREERKMLKRVQSSLVEGIEAAAQLAAAEAQELSQTIRTTCPALEEARKSLKELEDQVAFGNTVPGRNIKLENQSRWTIAKDADNLAQIFSDSFGDDLTKSSATEEEVTESTVNED
jgi:regulator of replication initiation timing